MSMPTIFVSHGSPTLILNDVPARAFLASLGQLLPRPKAIVAVSAHWDTDVPAVSLAPQARDHPRLLRLSRSALPPALRRAGRAGTRRAGGQAHRRRPRSASRARPRRLGAGDAGLARGRHPDLPALGAARRRARRITSRSAASSRPLREEGVLVMGSGSATHNLRALVRGRRLRARAVGQGLRRLAGGDGGEGRRGGAGRLSRAGAQCPRGPSDGRAFPAAACGLWRGGRGRARTRAPSQLHLGKSVDGVLRVCVGRGGLRRRWPA